MICAVGAEAAQQRDAPHHAGEITINDRAGKVVRSDPVRGNP
jgi:hypothetical protein